MLRSLVGSEMCIRDSQRRVRGRTMNVMDSMSSSETTGETYPPSTGTLDLFQWTGIMLVAGVGFVELANFTIEVSSKKNRLVHWQCVMMTYRGLLAWLTLSSWWEVNTLIFQDPWGLLAPANFVRYRMHPLVGGLLVAMESGSLIYDKHDSFNLTHHPATIVAVLAGNLTSIGQLYMPFIGGLFNVPGIFLDVRDVIRNADKQTLWSTRGGSLDDVNTKVFHMAFMLCRGITMYTPIVYFIHIATFLRSDLSKPVTVLAATGVNDRE
eukprot:TRINITY_DN24224_c0_g1_i11.p1 TRINITY_DN24224_c0_g1~~TRINITY_DN24224_c0_g1_i11.p1  ORF type:complete len:267 (-),score=48.34 TRINITY_DN24224_c0_g1_i11:180-980(-)